MKKKLKDRFIDTALFGVVGILLVDFFLIFPLKIYDTGTIILIISTAFGIGAAIGWIRSEEDEQKGE